MSCAINSLKHRVRVNQSIKASDGSAGFTLTETLLMTIWANVEMVEEKAEFIEQGRNIRYVWYDITTRITPMLQPLIRLNSLSFVFNGLTLHPKSFKIDGNTVIFKATYNYE